MCPCFYVSYVASFFYLPFRAFIVLRALHSFIFLRAYLPGFTFYVLHFFMCLTCHHFLRALRAFIILCALLAFTFLSVSNFRRALCTFTFLYKMWNNSSPATTSWNKQERDKISQNSLNKPKQLRTVHSFSFIRTIS